MPELPEVETVRLTLLPRLIGAQLKSVAIHRADIVTGRADATGLLAGGRIAELRRHGKQLAIMTADGRCVCVHLGMSGSLQWREPGTAAKHEHVVWQLDAGGELVFRDPRRFGGLWTFDNLPSLLSMRWGELGPDALHMTAGQLHDALQRTSRAVKAALLDQAVVAGLGNIYVDEVLFRCRVHPETPANRLDLATCKAIAQQSKRVLQRAVRAGGSTLRDFVDGHGTEGRFQNSHQVYGRATLPCVTCRATLMATQVGGRTTVYCPACQVRG